MFHFGTKIFRQEDDFFDEFTTAQNLGRGAIAPSIPSLGYCATAGGPGPWLRLAGGDTSGACRPVASQPMDRPSHRSAVLITTRSVRR